MPEIGPDPKVVTTLDDGTNLDDQHVEPSAAPDSASPDLKDSQEPSGYQFKDPETQAIFEALGEDGIKGMALEYAQYKQAQEAEEQRKQQEAWEKAQADQPNDDARAIDDIYQKIVRDKLSKAKPHSQEAADQMMRDAYSQATAVYYRNVAKEEAHRALGQYVQHTSQTAYEKQQVYAQRPDLAEFGEYIDDLVDRQGFPAKAVISRLDETINFMKKIGRYSDKKPESTPDYPSYQDVRQMGPIGGRHLSVVDPEADKKEQKEIDAIVDKIVNL